ncbi:MAG: hypothetical protein WDM94_01190 [Bauldia sp.]
MSATSDQGESEPAAARTANAEPLLRWLIRAASLGALKREASAAARAAAIRVMLSIAAVLLWLLVAGFLLGAFVVWLAGLVGGIAAAAIVAAVFAIAAIILQAVAAQMARHRHRFNFTAEFGKDAPIDPTTMGALAVAALAGFFVGNRGKR